MKTADELIDKIKIDEGNFHHITVTHKINGTLREEIRKAMSLFAMQEVVEALKLHGIVDPSTLKNECAIPAVSNSLLLDANNDIDTVGKCANCGVEFHIHKSNDC